MFIYAVRDKNTGKIVKDITNPGHKFWEVKGYCQKAIDNYNKGNYYRRRNPNYDLEMVTYKLVEVEDENK
jgi:hypothetical protein